MKTQTIILLPKLTVALQSPIADVPNQAGFKLLGILKNGPAIPLTVAVDANGCHYLSDQNHTHRAAHIFSGWVKDNAI